MTIMKRNGAKKKTTNCRTNGNAANQTTAPGLLSIIRKNILAAKTKVDAARKK